MRRPRLLDLFCGAGGIAMGYHRAGFDVVGVDIKPQPHYPFRFVQEDAMGLLNAATDYGVDVLADLFIDDGGGFDAIHASPPCQDHMRSPNPKQQVNGTGWMLGATRQRLAEIGLPWVIENVPGAPMHANYKLCGCMFGLPRLRRERWFEVSWRGFDLRPPCHHVGRAISVYGRPDGKLRAPRGHGVPGYKGTQEERVAAMGIDWMAPKELSQAIPPPYGEYIGRQVLEALAVPASP